MTVIKMTSDRTQAYGRVVKTLEDLGPSKLQPAEQDRIREAADALIFAAEPEAARAALEIRDAADTLIFAADLEEARTALADVNALAEHLVASARWTDERADQLVEDLLGCGPMTPVG